MRFKRFLPQSTAITFEDFIAEIEAEARAEGPEAVAELEAFRLHFSLAPQRSAQRLGPERVISPEA